MMRGVKLSMFTDEDLQRVHDYSVKLLKDNGINIASDRVVKIFRDHGFKTDGYQIYFTEEQINKALEERKIFGGIDLSKQYPQLGQSALYCVTEVHDIDDIKALVAALEEVCR